MPLYFIHIRGGESVAVDPEGQEFASLDDALHEIAFGAREIIADAIRAGKPLDLFTHKFFEIRDKAGDLILEVPFKEAFESGL